MKKLFFILTLGLIILLASCGGEDEPKNEQATHAAAAEQLNETQGGVGLPYNFQGTNRNSTQTITPLEE